MPRGLPLKYIKKYGISKKAWREYRKDIGTFKRKYGVSPVPHNPRKKRKRKGGLRGLARWRRRKSRGGMTIPIAPIAGLAAGLSVAVPAAIKGDYQLAINEVTRNYTGYDPWTKKFDPNHLKKGLLPLVCGLLVHKFVGGPPLNLNRTLGRAKVPLIRI